jgi:hypothetical protein
LEHSLKFLRAQLLMSGLPVRCSPPSLGPGVLVRTLRREKLTKHVVQRSFYVRFQYLANYTFQKQSSHPNRAPGIKEGQVFSGAEESKQEEYSTLAASELIYGRMM